MTHINSETKTRGLAFEKGASLLIMLLKNQRFTNISGEKVIF